MSTTYLKEFTDIINEIINVSETRDNKAHSLIIKLFQNIDKSQSHHNDAIVDLIVTYLLRSLNIINADDLNICFQHLLAFLKDDHTIEDTKLISKIVTLLNNFTTEFDLINNKAPYFFEFKYFFLSKYCVKSFYGNFLYSNATDADKYTYRDNIITTAAKNAYRNASLLEKYNNAMLILDNPAMTILNSLHSKFNGTFNSGEDAISPNSKTIINVIKTCMEAFEDKIKYFKKYSNLEAFNDVRTLSLSIQDFYQTLSLKTNVSESKSVLGVDHLEFFANSEYSSLDDLKFLYEPITENFNTKEMNIDVTLDLKDLSPGKATLVANSVVYVKFLATVFLIKFRIFLRYMQDLRTLFTDIYAIFSHNPDLQPSSALDNIKNTIRGSVTRNSLHYLKTVLTNEYRNFSNHIDYKRSSSAVFIDTNLELFYEQCEENSYDFKKSHLHYTEPTPLVEPTSLVDKPYIFKASEHKHDDEPKFAADTNFDSLLAKFDEFKDLANNAPLEKNQDDWCAFNMVYKLAPKKDILGISKLENFKTIKFDDVLSSVYPGSSFEETSEKLKKEIEELTAKQSVIQGKVNDIKESNKKLVDMMYLSNADFINVYKVQFEPDKADVTMEEDAEPFIKVEHQVATIEKNSLLKGNSSQTSTLVYRKYPKRVLTADEGEGIFIDTKEQLTSSADSEKKPVRTSRRFLVQEEASVNEDGTMSKIKFLLPKKSYREDAIIDDDYEDEDSEDTKFLEAKKNLQLKEAELSEGNENEAKEEDEILKSEYDDECSENTKANNVSDVPDLKTLKKYNALNTEELRTYLDSAGTSKRRLGSGQEDIEEESGSKKMKVSED